MRTLTGYSEAEIKELMGAKENTNIFDTIGNIETVAPILSMRFGSNGSEYNDVAVVQDIADFFAGEAEFEEKTYVYKLIGITNQNTFPIFLAGTLDKLYLTSWSIDIESACRMPEFQFTKREAEQALESGFSRLTLYQFEAIEVKE